VTALDGVYERALRRIRLLSAIVGAAAIAGAMFLFGWRAALGCAVGGSLAFFNLGWFKALADAIGGTGKAPHRGSAALLAIRFLLLAAVIFVTIRVFGVSILAIIAGLLVSAAAVLIELVYELVLPEPNE
jgi:ATP synthase I chain